MYPPIEKDKLEAIKQWTDSPCGFLYNTPHPEGSPEFFEQIDRNRYHNYMPWLMNAVEFKQAAGQKILEVGFGMGTDLFQFAQTGAEVHGIDLSPRHFELATKRFAQSPHKAHLQLADAESIPFPDSYFDIVYSFGVLHHTPHMEKALAEIHRVLKPGGQIILGVYNKLSAFHIFSVFLPYVLKFKFLHRNYRSLLADIEFHQEGNAQPLVRLYTAGELRRLLFQFKNIHISCHHLEAAHFWFFRHLVSKGIKWMESKLGWYLLAKGRR